MSKIFILQLFKYLIEFHYEFDDNFEYKKINRVNE